MDSFNPNSTVIFDISLVVCQRESADFAFQATVELLTMIVGFPANVMVLWVLLCRKSAVSSAEIFLLNLAVMDALVCLSAPLGTLNSLLDDYSILRATQFQYFITLAGNPMFLCCICVERYMAVLHPVHFMHMKSRSFRVEICTLAWAFTIAIPVYEAAHQFESYSHLLAVYTSVLLVVMVLCNVSILWSLMQSGPGRDEVHPVKKKAFQTVFTTFIISLLFYFLPAVYLLQRSIEFITLQCYVMPVCSSIVIPLPLFYLYNMGRLPCVPFPCCAKPNPVLELC
ncbi:hydroxycarboxylic acid receptor 2-like [Polyodon spathula]|uniref:hydroxycarboxylic acid receptor 2-like n=1 Tax=Polyodon spathula TaxID=7913 RepID=UPI001B7E4A00|nr:hydroxycarboxylic acid receptor 2-like [Polyodon spathula]